jgi:hypothetical protein
MFGVLIAAAIVALRVRRRASRVHHGPGVG